MGMVKCDIHDRLKLRRTHGFMEDWDAYTSGGLFTTTADGAASATVGNTSFGVITLAAVDNTINRQVYVATTNSIFLIQNNHNLVIEEYIQFTEAATNKANVAIGFMSGVGLASLLDATGEPKASWTGAIIYKVPGGTKWKTASSVGTTSNVSQSDTVAGGSSFAALKIEIEPVSATVAEVTYYVNDVQLKTAGGRPGTSLIKDQLTYTSAAQMQAFIALKNGSGNAETLLCDYLAWEQLRAPLY